MPRASLIDEPVSSATQIAGPRGAQPSWRAPTPALTPRPTQGPHGLPGVPTVGSSRAWDAAHVSALIVEYHYSDGERLCRLGEYCGMLLAAVSILAHLARIAPAPGAVAIPSVSANLLSLVVHGLPAVIPIRLLSGLGCVWPMAVSWRSLRNLNIVRTSCSCSPNSITNVVILYTFPPIMTRFGFVGMFVSYTALLLAHRARHPRLPDARRVKLVVHSALRATSRTDPFMVCLFAVFSFYLMIGATGLSGATWNGDRYDAAFVGICSLGILLSLVSCLTAYRLSSARQSRPLLFALGIIAVTFWVTAAGSDADLHRGAGTRNFFWNFTDIYQFARSRASTPGVLPRASKEPRCWDMWSRRQWRLASRPSSRVARLLALFGSYVARHSLPTARCTCTRQRFAITSPSARQIS